MLDPVFPGRVLVCSTPVGALGSGIGGGVELTLHGLVDGLGGLGVHVEVAAPAGSLHVGAAVHQITGALQSSSQIAPRDAPVTMPADPVIASMWSFVRERQHRYDIVLNLAYDWLPFYVTPFLDVPVAHLVSMASVQDSMDDVITRLLAERPGTVAMHSQAQAATFGSIASGVRVIGNGIAVDRYDVHVVADDPPYLGFVGRISPEKGLEDVAALAARTGMPMRVWGLMQDEAYWKRVVRDHPDARMEHRGFLATDELQAELGGCTAIVMTPKWVEAFGNVAIEAMACGVPVIAYRRGGPAEIVVDGTTGFLVEPDDIDGLVHAVERAADLDRIMCRQLVEERFSTSALAVRVRDWLADVVRTAPARELQ